MADYKVDQHLDCKGLLCPMPVVKTRNMLKNLQIGDVLEMVSTDPGSMPDMHAWSKQTGHELLEATDEGKTFRFVIRKSH